jgi:hypothetical protein
MATSFPTGLDSFTNPSSGQFLNSPSHSQQHDNINDAMAAVQAKMGINGSGVTTSFTYKLGGVTGTDLAVSKTGVETLTNKTLTAPTIATILTNAGAATLTLPTSTDTLVGRATTDTLTNKTLTSPKIGTQILDSNGALLITVSATASAVNGISIINSATGVDPQILPGGTDATRNLNLRGKGLAKTVVIGAGAVPIFQYDFVYSGLIITADSVGVNKNYSISSGVVVINGNPVTVAAVSAQTVGASKDRYIDILDNGDGTGIYITTEVANNSASPALAANSIRIGIVVAGATTIATTGSLNQGQETIVLPIASSTAYTTTDSLGNLICPRDPNRKILGYRQIVANFASAATAADITGLNLTCIIPTGRKVRVSAFIGGGSASVTNNAISLAIFDVTAGATIAFANADTNASADAVSVNPTVISSAGGTRTYKAQLSHGNNASTSATNSAVANPSYIMVELN